MWDRLHQVLLTRLREADKIDFSRAVADSSSVRAVHGEKTGPNPTDRRKAGSRHHTFPEDPAARTALQSVARNDRKLLNREVAERALLGDGLWNDYVLASMKDDSQSSRQRLEPLRWMLDQNMPLAPLANVVLGTDRQVFFDLLVLADKEMQSGFLTRALRAISSVKHADTAGFLLEVFDTAPDYNRLRLLEAHLNDPAARLRVEAIAADPSNETLQAAAAGMLER